jgi:hypothetical protein
MQSTTVLTTHQTTSAGHISARQERPFLTRQYLQTSAVHRIPVRSASWRVAAGAGARQSGSHLAATDSAPGGRRLSRSPNRSLPGGRQWGTGGVGGTGVAWGTSPGDVPWRLSRPLCTRVTRGCAHHTCWVWQPARSTAILREVHTDLLLTASLSS